MPKMQIWRVMARTMVEAAHHVKVLEIAARIGLQSPPAVVT
jgi:hypothetical protein